MMIVVVIYNLIMVIHRYIFLLLHYYYYYYLVVLVECLVYSCTAQLHTSMYDHFRTCTVVLHVSALFS